VLVPLLALSFGAIFAGYLFAEKFVGAERMEFWRGAIFTLPTNQVLAAKEGPEWELWAPLTVTAIGFAMAWFFYVLNEGSGARIAARQGPLWRLFYNKWYFDEIYDLIFVRGAKALGDLFWKVGDQKIIDGLGPDGVAAVSAAVGRGAGRVQTGYVYHYAFVMLLGVAGLLSFALWAWG
jgi:NADH-quinone oxidoreductase subunit L